MRVRDFLASWSRGSGEAEVGRAWHTNRVACVTRVLPLVGDVELEELTHSHVHAVRIWAREEQGLSPATANRFVAALLALIRDAEFAGLVATDQRMRILGRTKMLRERPNVAYAAFSAGERDQILDVFRQPRFAHYLPYVCWQFFCGTRISEGLGLHCEDVDPARQWAQIVRSRNGDDVNDDAKTGHARRVVKLPRVVCAALAPLDLDDVGAYLFRGPEGAPLDRHNFTQRVWRAALEQLHGSVPRRPFTATRHTAITLQCETGNLTPYQAAKYFGTSENMIRARYTRAVKDWAEVDIDAGLLVQDHRPRLYPPAVARFP